MFLYCCGHFAKACSDRNTRTQVVAKLAAMFHVDFLLYMEALAILIFRQIVTFCVFECRSCSNWMSVCKRLAFSVYM